MKRRFADPEFAAWQKRRVQTGSRIAIFKREFLGSPLRSKGFAHRELSCSPWPSSSMACGCSPAAPAPAIAWPRPLSDRAGGLRSFYRRGVFTIPQKATKSGGGAIPILSNHPAVPPVAKKSPASFTRNRLWDWL